MTPQETFWLWATGLSLFSILAVAYAVVLFDRRSSPSASGRVGREEEHAIPRVVDGEPIPRDYDSENLLLAIEDYNPQYGALIRERRQQLAACATATRPHVQTVVFLKDWRPAK